MKSRSLWRNVLIAIAVVLVALAVYHFRSGQTSPYETAAAERSTVRSEVSVTGKVTPAKSIDLSFEQTGTLSGIAGSVGDQVSAGQTIATLDASALQAGLAEAQSALASAQADLAAILRGTRPEELSVEEQQVENAQSALSDTEQATRDKLHDAYTRTDDAIHSYADALFANPDTIQPTFRYTISNGQLTQNLQNERVELGGLLMMWNSRVGMLDTANDSTLSQYANDAQIILSKTALFLDNTAQAIAQISYTNSVPAATLATYTANISTARTSINAATANLTAAGGAFSDASGALSLAQKQLNLSKAGATKEDVDAAQAKVANAQATVDKTNTQIAKSTLHAPFAGVITALPLEKGAVVTPASIVATIQTTDALEIIAYIPEVDIANVAPGKTADATLDAYGDTTKFFATVTKVDPAETILDGVPTYKTTLAFSAPDTRIKPGMTANVDILIDEHDNVVAIPSRTISYDTNGNPTAEVLLPSGATETRTLTIGLKSFDGKTEILSGINEGEKVILPSNS